MNSFEQTLTSPSLKQMPQTFHGNWYLKLNDPTSHRALWLRFTVLSSRNGFKRVAETWAVYFHRISAREVRKVALKQTYDLNALSLTGESGIQIGPCLLDKDRSHGSIHSKGNSISW